MRIIADINNDIHVMRKKENVIFSEIVNLSRSIYSQNYLVRRELHIICGML